MSVLQNVAIIDSLQIRDTSDHYSPWEERGVGVVAALREIIIAAAISLDQAAGITVQVSRDAAGTNVWDVGTSNPDISLAASDGAAFLTGYQTLSEPWPFLRVKITCSVAPAAGQISIYQVG